MPDSDRFHHSITTANSMATHTTITEDLMGKMVEKIIKDDLVLLVLGQDELKVFPPIPSAKYSEL